MCSVTKVNLLIHLKTMQPKGVQPFLGLSPTMYKNYSSKAQSSSGIILCMNMSYGELAVLCVCQTMTFQN